MQAGAERDRQQFVPGRMKIDLVDAMAETVEAAQARQIFVGVEAKLDGLRLAQRRAERVEAGLAPAGAFALDRLAQHDVA